MIHSLISRSTQVKSRCWVVSCGFVLFINLPLPQIQISYSAPNVGVAAAFGRVQDDQARQLEPGKPIRRELASEQQHTYQIRLGADQFLKIIIEQNGIDVVAQVSGPDVKQVLEFDSESRTRGEEAVSLVADAAADYRLVVRPKQKGIPVGSYEIRIEELRAATDTDRGLHEARKQYQESRKLLSVGKPDEALPLAERALEIRERLLGSEHPEVAVAINGLGEVYSGKGEYVKAEPLYKRGLDIREKVLGKDHPDTSESLNNLAFLYQAQGKYAEAEPLYIRALDIFEKALGKDHQDTATSINNLAELYRLQGKYTEAEPLYKRALDIDEKALGKDHPNTAISLNSLASLYREQGKYAEAEPLYKRALDIRERALGPEHASVATTLNHLAVLYTAKGELGQAVTYQSHAGAVSEHNLALNLATGSERQKIEYLALFLNESDFTLSLHSQNAPRDPRALELAFTTVLRRKGRGLDAMTDAIGALRRRAAPQDRALFDRLAETRSQLATLTLRASNVANPDTYRTRLMPLEEKVDELEAELSSRSAEFRMQSQPVTLAAVQAALPGGSALIEFAVFTPQDPQTRKNQPPRYLAYLLAAQGQPRWIDLGEAAPIDLAIDRWRKALRNPYRPDVKRLAREVDDKVMRPVRSLISEIHGETRHLLIAPDGLLNLVPFAALVDEQNRYLVERYTISYLTSGRDLLRTPAPQQNRNAPLIVANPAFGRSTSVVAPTATNSENSQADKQAGDQSQVRADLTPIVFQPLPGTEGEAVAIKTVLPDAKMLLWKRATETAIKQVRAPRVLHIATHGFFLSNQEAPSTETRGSFGEDSLRMSDLRLGRWATYIKDPLMRSGLALAGANHGQSEGDDGMLTALEVAGLDLWGTTLVVLSACDTGVGEVKNGDGVDGLRRALVLAGSDTQVMSLWPVSDRVTRELMADYYNGLTRGQGRGEALRRVQLRMLKNVKRQHPFYWAAFIQSGEWANLEGRR